MDKQIHYGTVTHWFTDLQRGSVLSDDHGTQRILLEAYSLTPNYRCPQSGDRISFSLHEDGRNRLCAENATLLPPLAENERIEITLSDWNYQQNGGYGIHHVQRNSPIFVLGQFLNDQTRIPENGETLEGRLVKHSNGQWLLVEVDIIEKTPAPLPDIPIPEDIPAPPPPPPRWAKNTTHEAQNTELPAALPANRVLGGTIARWNDEKGYGFIATENRQNVFFHISAFHYMSQRPRTDQKVSFYCNRPVGSEPQRAMRVVLSGHEASLFSERPYDYHEFNLNMRKLLCYGLFGSLYLFGVAYFSPIVAAFYCLTSAAAFWLYRSDKQTAVTQSHKKQGYLGRVPEKKLHQIGLLGGWPGALFARGAYNHKTGKASFIRIFWITVAINIAITYGLLIHYCDNPVALFLKS
ncbi:DUF1294 domain-containing protein [Neisseria dumasiana]|uniref:Cold-shock domain-containing protein n=1 Tax=Neisseria dumasiana TaxID=1931275 RepID=A0A1X3DK52_9NEIS|nr:DUF1294 domain-containing protein [Neisseria dumasiana]OSI17008.1 hypothetical protein BV914_02385 [Neisseria dumasiana]OSI23919.1 hypothetical protein BV912_03430 [Neisseria dumasiana]